MSKPPGLSLLSSFTVNASRRRGGRDATSKTHRKDFEDRRRRQAQGIVEAKAAGAYRGRPEDTDRNAGIAGMLRSGMWWTAIQAATCCSRATIAKVAKRAA